MSFSESFFEVAAQLIPVLFLAMVVEGRFQQEADETPGDRVVRSGLLALIVPGEVIALSVVAGGLNPSKGTGSIVAGAMLLAAFLLTVPVLNRELKDDRSIWNAWGMLALDCLCCCPSSARSSRSN